MCGRLCEGSGASRHCHEAWGEQTRRSVRIGRLSPGRSAPQGLTDGDARCAHYCLQRILTGMRLSGSAGFFLHDALRRAGIADGRAFCLRTDEGRFLLDADWPDSEDSLAVLRGRYGATAGYRLEVDWPGVDDKVAVFREMVILAIEKTLDEQLANARLDARAEGDSVSLMLSTSIAWPCLSQNE